MIKYIDSLFLTLVLHLYIGPSGVAPLHHIVVTALAHSLSSALVHVNHRRILQIRDLALLQHIPADYLTKTNILTALLDACEDTYIHTAHNSVVVIDDHPAWLLSDESASEVLLSELKSLSSKIMFIAVPPTDALKANDFIPSARPLPIVVPPTASAENEMGQENPFAAIANMFNNNNNNNNNDGNSNNNNNPFSESNLPPSLKNAMFSNSILNTNTNKVNPSANANTIAPGGQSNALVGRSVQVVRA